MIKYNYHHKPLQKKLEPKIRYFKMKKLLESKELFEYEKDFIFSAPWSNII